MSTPTPLIITLICTLIAGLVNASGWHYGDEEHWSPLCREGKLQSPIALSRDLAEERQYLAFIFENYAKEYAVNLKNNGHSAELRLQVQNQPSVKGGGLPEIYVLDHLHFHWQSEHIIDNFRFPLELHMVHYARIYANLKEALEHPGGVAVFSVLFDLSPDDDSDFQPLITVIDELHDKIDTIKRINFNIHDVLPRDTAGFYRYNGSLTTPDCTEGVIWTVFTNTLPISKSQVKSFLTMHDSDHKELPKNYRTLQQLNGRHIYLKVSPIRSAGNNFKISIFNIVVLVNCILFSYF